MANKPNPKKPTKSNKRKLKAGRKKTSQAKFNLFFKALEVTGKIKQSAISSGIHHDVIYQRKQDDPNFRNRVEQATQKRFIKLNELLVSKFGEATISELLKILSQCYAKHYDKDRNKMHIRQVYAMFNRMVVAAIEFVPPEQRSSFLQTMDDALSESEAVDDSGNVKKLRGAIINGKDAPPIESDVEGDDSGLEE